MPHINRDFHETVRVSDSLKIVLTKADGSKHVVVDTSREPERESESTD